MITSKVLLALVGSAVVVSAAPPSLYLRQSPDFGSCSRCTSAVNELAPYCHAKPAEECKKACEVSTIIACR